MTLELLRRQVADEPLTVAAVVLNPGALAKKLAKAGVSVTVIAENQNNSVQILHALLNVAGHFKPDVIHTHRQKENVLGALAARSLGCKSIRTEHGWTEFPNFGWRLDKRIFAFLNDYSGRHWQQGIAAVSDDLAARLRPIYTGKRITVIENGINIADIRKAATAYDADIDRSAVNIGMVARLVPVKAHWRFIDAAAVLLEESNRPYHFHIIGDGPLRNRLVGLVAERRLTPRVTFHGFLPTPLPLVANFNALVICSDHEGLPMNALEAAALGVPIVTTELPSILKILNTGAKGEISKDTSPRALARAIENAVANPDKKSGINVDSWVYSSSNMAGKYYELYHQVARTGSNQ